MKHDSISEYFAETRLPMEELHNGGTTIAKKLSRWPDVLGWVYDLHWVDIFLTY